jgi:hypothetical protein
MMNTNKIATSTESAINSAEKRWCASHFGEAPADAGSYVLCSKTKRWICDRCQEKRLRRKTEIRAIQAR